MKYLEARQKVIDYVHDHPIIKHTTLLRALPRLLHIEIGDAREIIRQLVIDGDLAKAKIVNLKGKQRRTRGRPATHYAVSPSLEKIFADAKRKQEFTEIRERIRRRRDEALS